MGWPGTCRAAQPGRHLQGSGDLHHVDCGALSSPKSTRESTHELICTWLNIPRGQSAQHLAEHGASFPLLGPALPGSWRGCPWPPGKEAENGWWVEGGRKEGCQEYCSCLSAPDVAWLHLVNTQARAAASWGRAQEGKTVANADLGKACSQSLWSLQLSCFCPLSTASPDLFLPTTPLTHSHFHKPSCILNLEHHPCPLYCILST